MTDANLERFYDLLTTGTGIVRERHPELEREAAERAFEARQQVGLFYVDPASSDIRHPPQSEREARLGPEWSGKGVSELAAWNYEYLDPIKALVDHTRTDGVKVGLLNSEPHRAILRDTRFRHWGAGIYTELPDGLEEWRRRYYAVIWLSVDVPTVAPVPAEPRFSDVQPGARFYDDVEELAALGVISGFPDGTFRPGEPITRGQVAALLNRLRKLP